jgi:signal transduction histidine kinase
LRKTSLTFLLFIEIVTIFLFFNINQLFISLGQSEIDRIKEQTRQFAALTAKSPETLVPQLRASGLFRTVNMEPGSPGEEARDDLDPPLFIVRSPVRQGHVLKLTAPLDSHPLATIRKIHSVSTGVLVIGGLMLLGTAATLVVQIRKGRAPAARPMPIDPLQTYLLDLKGREIKMQQEVSDHRQTVEQKESLTGLILNQVHFAVIILGRGDRVQLFNRKAEQIFQKSFASVVNRPISDVLSEHGELVRFIQDPQKTGQSQEISSQAMTLNCCATPLPHDGLLITLDDITQLQEARRLELGKKTLLQLGEMAAYLSHEVRNSLGVIYGYSKTLRDSDPKIELINAEIHFLTGMMERFLGFSRPTEAPRQDEFPLSPIAEELCKAQGLDCVLTDPGESSVLADPHLIRNVLDNLVRNARQAEATRVAFTFRRTPRMVEMTLTDNGNGIPSELIGKIWFPFFTTREKGNGMGLALSRKLVNAMGGEIDLLESRPGMTRFVLRLPSPQT